MNGLLDFIKTPEGQGLLSAAFGGLAGARRGQPLNSIGRAGLAGLQGYGSAQDRITQEADATEQRQMRTFQMEDLKRKQSQQQAQEKWRTGLPDVLRQAETTYGAGDEGPTMKPGNPQALNQYMMDPNSPFADKLMEQQLFPKAEDYRVVGGDLVKIGSGGVSVAHQSQRPDNLPSEQKLYNLAKEQGYGGTLMEFMRDRVSNTEGARASFDVMPVTLPNGETVLLPRSTVATQSGGGAPKTGAPTPKSSGNFTGSGYQGGSASAAAGDQRAILQRELDAATAQGRTEDVAALNRELSRLPGGAPQPGRTAGFPVQSKAQEAAAVEKAKIDAKAGSAESQSAKAAQRDSIQAQIAVIDKAIAHPGRKTATGLSGVIDPRNYTPGTNARDFQVVLDQLGGAAFLQAFESLKGGGQITEVEGKKATDAIARLNRAQSDKEFEVALNDLRDVMQKGYDRLGGGGGANASWGDKPTRKIVKTGTYGGKKVIQYEDGSTEYAN